MKSRIISTFFLTAFIASIVGWPSESYSYDFKSKRQGMLITKIGAAFNGDIYIYLTENFCTAKTGGNVAKISLRSVFGGVETTSQGSNAMFSLAMSAHLSRMKVRVYGTNNPNGWGCPIGYIGLTD